MHPSSPDPDIMDLSCSRPTITKIRAPTTTSQAP